MGEVVGAFVAGAGGTLFAVTSRRTGGAVTRALRLAVGGDRHLYAWRKDDPDNPYRALLAEADALVVTGDSESMLAEATATGKPVYIYELPERPHGPVNRLRKWVADGASSRPLTRKGTVRPQQGREYLCARLIQRGLVRPPSDLGELHRNLFDRGLALPFPSPLRLVPRQPLNETDVVAARSSPWSDSLRRLPGRCRPMRSGTRPLQATESGMTSTPRVWVLLGKGVGGNGQMKSLADALGWPYDCKQVVHGFLSGVPNLILGASLASLDRRRSSPLEPPWPDLLIAASRRSVPVARWIRRQSGGRTRLVHLLHAQAPLSLFDLVLTLPQYRLPERTNVLHLTAPLNRTSLATLREAAERFEPRFHELPRPRIGLLVGGNSSSYRLEAETAARLGRETSRMARLAGGSLLVTTSPRTPKEASDALFASLDAPAYCYRWRPDDPENPYHAYLALAIVSWSRSTAHRCSSRLA
jgi:mitochondrial fission protein ELM1